MADKTSARVRRGEAQWQAILSAFVASGLSQKAFCEREGLALSTFQHWKRRLGAQSPSPAQGPASAAADVASVIDLGTLEDHPAGWEVEIALGEGVSLTLRRR